MGERPTDEPPNDRLTVAQTAGRLGISEDAVRSRIKRGTLRAERDSGAVIVLLYADQPTTSEATDQPTEGPTDARDALIEEMRDRVRSLEESNRENRRIIAGLVQRIPELEAPPQNAQEAQDVAENASDTSPGPVPFETEQSAPSSRQSRWQRLRRACRVE